ncbi:PREDICTED: volume-regulated anion channel subunit LRRC8A-like, partial [Acropora digitifera]|uniref:volume-regulated anion channel subunit LRRC8A-like n=1 Tax=Acropora digitifera TaxID=70779 RepID=UPI00077A202E
MDSEKPNFHTTKLLTTWWDLVDHYVLAVMLAVSVASVGLQTTQDRLICIPAVRCSDFEGNDSVVRRWKEYRDVLDTCDQSSSSVVLTKMSDRRQYDYIDNECFKKLHWFSAYYSLIFLAETVILLAISNFWQKYSNSASALAHCENLLSEFIKGDILVSAGEETQRPQQQPQNQQKEQQQQQQQQQQGEERQ